MKILKKLNLQKMKKIGLLCFFILAANQISGCGQKTEENATEASQKVTIETQTETEVETDTTGEAQSQPEEETAEVNQVSIIMVGDMLLHDRVEEVSLQDDGSYDYSAIFEHTKDEISAADIAIANQEVIIGGQDLGISGYPAFNAPYEFADALVTAGFDVACHGTNHALDKGGQGIRNCLNYWRQNYPQIGVLGIHDSAESQNEIYTTTINGITVAILNYTFGTNGISQPEDMPFAVDYLSQDKVVADLTKAEEEADFTIVCPHWGTEYSLIPDSSQDKWAEIFVENGADLIIGTHPHVIEPIEWVTSENGNQALCYYSLGNFVNWTSGEGQGTSNRMVGGMAQVTLEETEGGQVEIADYDVEALVSHVTSQKGGVTVYPLAEYTEELADENEIRLQDDSFSLEYCKNLVSQVWYGENCAIRSK